MDLELNVTTRPILRSFCMAELDRLTATQRPYEVRDPKIPGLVVRVEPSGRKSWFQILQRPDGRRTRVRLGLLAHLSLEPARAAARVNLGDVARGIDVAQRRRDLRVAAKVEATRRRKQRHETLRRFVDDVYLPWAEAHQKCGPENVRRIKAAFARQLEEPLARIDQVWVEEWRQRRVKAGANAAGVNRDVSQLSSVLSRAAKCGLIPRNPLSGMSKLREDRSRTIRFLNADEEERLRTELCKRDENARSARERFIEHRTSRGLVPPPPYGPYPDHLTPIVLLALNTGMRRGEILSLRWRALPQGRNRVIVEGRTAKSLQTREVPLNAEARSIVSSLRSSAAGARPDDYVFASEDGGRMDNFQTSWDTIRRAASLTDFRFHDLRHTFASRLVQAGVDLFRVKELMGHADISMTLRYAHLRADDLVAAVELVALKQTSGREQIAT